MIGEGPIRRDLKRSADFRIRTAGFTPREGPISSCQFAAAGLAEVTSEHHSAVNLLLRFERFSSAQALLRPCVEAGLRTVWLLRCATERDMDELQAGAKDWPSLESIIGNVEGAHRSGGFIRKILPPRRLLNELTHGGFAQIATRILPIAFKRKLTDVSIEQMHQLIAAFCIRTSDRMLCLSFCAMHLDLGDPAKATELGRAHEETVKTYECNEGRVS